MPRLRWKNSEIVIYMKYKKIIFIITFFLALLLCVLNEKKTNQITISENEKGLCFYIPYGNKKTETIYPWYDDSTGIWELFLPSHLNKNDTIKVVLDTEAWKFPCVETKNNCLSLENKIIYEMIDSDNNTSKFRINFSENISSIFIKSESGTMRHINDNKSHEEKGTICSINKNGEVEYSGNLESISGRGNGTWQQAKKPYNLKLTAQGALAGLKPSKNWTLLAMHYEGDKIHSKIAYDLEKILGGKYPSECTWVDVYFNGKYNGVYLLNNSVKGRFEFNTDGFLIEKELGYRVEGEHFFTDSGEAFEIKKSNSNPEQIMMNAQECEDTIFANQLNSEKLDIESFVIQMMVDEISLNADSFKTSSYIYKLDGDSKVYAGPSWDYDGAFGEYLHQGENMVDPEGTHIVGGDQLEWYYSLYENPEILNMIAEKYENHAEELEYLINVKIDEYADYIRTAIENENIRWKFTEGTLHRAGTYRTWDNNVRYLKYFLNHRMNYLLDEYGIKSMKFEWEKTDKVHNVEFILNENETKLVQVIDGERITNLPGDENWCFSYSGEEYYDVLPILEDCTFVIEES